MASIIERQGRFLVRVRLGGFKPVAKTFTTKKDAQAFGRRVEADMESGRWAAEAVRAPSLREAIRRGTLNSFIGDFYANRQGNVV